MISTRLATADDAREAVAVLRRSITELCALDHQNDRATLERWLANKTAEHFVRWLDDPTGHYLVACSGAAIAGVAAFRGLGEICLCYVHPDCVRSGVGRALLSALETEASRRGFGELTLRSSLTARAFYESSGYAPSGDPVPLFGVLCGYPYAKRLGVSG